MRTHTRFHLGVDLGERVDYSAVAAVRLDGDGIDLVHVHLFKLGAGHASVIGYVNTLRDRWTRVHAAYIDNTKHGDYIIQDLKKAGVPEANNITFTQDTKQEMTQLLGQRITEGKLHIPYDRDLLDELNTE